MGIVYHDKPQISIIVDHDTGKVTAISVQQVGFSEVVIGGKTISARNFTYEEVAEYFLPPTECSEPSPPAR